MSLRLSVLDVSPVDEGSTARDALIASTNLARHAEELGYERFWVAEHHHTDSLASTAPEMLMMHLAANTSRIRVGSGGVMLPHYSSIKVAGNYKLIEALYPNRVDLGFGRAPGADSLVTHALNEEKQENLPYPQKVQNLKAFVTGEYPIGHRFASTIVRPEIDTLPQMWMLGASGNTAELAAQEGLGFTFAHFINPSGRGPRAAENYRRAFRPSVVQHEPGVIVAVFVAVADTDEEALALTETFHLWLARVESAYPLSFLPSLATSQTTVRTPADLAAIARNRPRMISGTAPDVFAQLEALAKIYGTDQLMVNPLVPGERARLRTLELLAESNGASRR